MKNKPVEKAQSKPERWPKIRIVDESSGTRITSIVSQAEAIALGLDKDSLANLLSLDVWGTSKMENARVVFYLYTKANSIRDSAAELFAAAKDIEDGTGRVVRRRDGNSYACVSLNSLLRLRAAVAGAEGDSK